jgi:hypothetical protein
MIDPNAVRWLQKPLLAVATLLLRLHHRLGADVRARLAAADLPRPLSPLEALQEFQGYTKRRWLDLQSPPRETPALPRRLPT